MAGNSNSGRHNRAREAKRMSLGDMCTDYIRDNWDKFTEAQRMKIALTIAQRTVADKSEVTASVTTEEVQTMIYNTARDMVKGELNAN